MEAIINKTQRRTLATELAEIGTCLTWGKIARRYLGKSSSWMYNKMLGRDGNGGQGGFSPEEVEQVRMALLDFSADLARTAKNL